MSIRDTILAANDVPEETVDVPEWDVKLLIRGLAAGEAVDFYERVMVTKNGEQTVNRKVWGPELLIACSFDPETLKPVFEAADRDALSRKSSAVVIRLAGVAARLSGLGGDKEEIASLDDAP